MAVLLKTTTTAMMAQHPAAKSAANASSATAITSSASQQQLKNPMFHDFLGIKPPSAAAPEDARPSESSPAASVSAGASSGGGRGGPISITSDLGSERQVSNHFEGVPFYGPRSDISGPEISNRLERSKRSSSDSAFMGSARDGMAQIGPEGHENLHLMKMLRNGSGGERQRRSNDDEVFIGTQPLRQASASLILHPGTSSRNDPGVSKWERSAPINMGPALQFPPRGGQFMPLMHQAPQSRYRDIHASTPIVSQPAADEGSRTGMKGPGILSSINALGGSEKNSPVGPQSGGKPKSGMLNTDPESSNPPSRHGLASSSRQMTIFYGGQAHVFDDVHPNKADIIMALAGSNGGSWSTTFSPKSGLRPTTEGNVLAGENETGGASNAPLPRDFRGKLPVSVNSGHGLDSSERISNTIGGLQSSIMGKDARNPAQPAERVIADEKRDL